MSEDKNQYAAGIEEYVESIVKTANEIRASGKPEAIAEAAAALKKADTDLTDIIDAVEDGIYDK